MYPPTVITALPLETESTEDQLKFGAVEPGVLTQPYFTTPVWRVVRSRVGWLTLLFVAETATGTVLRHFEEPLAKVQVLNRKSDWNRNWFDLANAISMRSSTEGLEYLGLDSQIG